MTAEYGPFARRKFTAADFAEEQSPRPAVEPRSFSDEEFQAEPRTLSATPEDTMFPGTPVYARGARKKDAGSVIPKAALVAIPAVLLAAGAIYLISRPSADDLFAESAAPVPGPAAAAASARPLAPTAQQAAPIQQASAPATVAANTSAPTPTVQSAASETARTSTPTPTRTARAAAVPAPVASAMEADNPQNWATDASATLPEAPIPYSAIGQTSAPSPAAAAPPLLDPAPATTPAPAAQEGGAEPTP